MPTRAMAVMLIERSLAKGFDGLFLSILTPAGTPLQMRQLRLRNVVVQLGLDSRWPESGAGAPRHAKGLGHPTPGGHQKPTDFRTWPGAGQPLPPREAGEAPSEIRQRQQLGYLAAPEWRLVWGRPAGSLGPAYPWRRRGRACPSLASQETDSLWERGQHAGLLERTLEVGL